MAYKEPHKNVWEIHMCIMMTHVKDSHLSHMFCHKGPGTVRVICPAQVHQTITREHLYINKICYIQP